MPGLSYGLDYDSAHGARLGMFGVLAGDEA